MIDSEKHILGVVALDDTLTRFMPQFVDLLRSTDFVHDFAIQVAQRSGGSIMRLLISQAIFSNIAGMATLVGDPPNSLFLGGV